LLFSYTTKVVWLGNIATSLDIGDLPIVPANMRSICNYTAMRKTMQSVPLRVSSWSPRPGRGWQLSWQLIRLNYVVFAILILLAAISAVLFYTPAYFFQHFVFYLEIDPERKSKGWGWVYVVGLFATNAIVVLGTCLS